MTILGFVDESGTISQLFKGNDDIAVLSMIVMDDHKYAKFKNEWMKELQKLFEEIFTNMAKAVSSNPFELYKIEDIMTRRPKMELHTQDLVSKEHLFAFINSEPSTKRLEPFVDILTKYIDRIYALLIKRSSQYTQTRKCSDNKVAPWILTKFTEVVVATEDLQDDLFIMVIDTDPKAESPYSYETVLEFLRKRFYDTSSQALNKFNAISIFLSPSEWEPGIQAVDLVSYIIRKVHSSKTRDSEKRRMIHGFYNKLKVNVSRIRLFEVELDECDKRSVENSQVREVKEGGGLRT